MQDQNQRSARVRRLRVSRLGFVLLAATVLSLINTGSVLQRTSSFSRGSLGIFALQTVTEVALLWCTMAALVLPAAFNIRILKVWTLLLVALGLIASYYVVRLNVGIDMSVIRSILSTDQQEVVEFIDPLSLLLLVAVVGMTTAVLAVTSIVPRSQVREDRFGASANSCSIGYECAIFRSRFQSLRVCRSTRVFLRPVCRAIHHSTC